MLQEVVFVVLMIVHATKEHIDCGMYTAANGTSCFLCPPGYYKIRDCDENGMPAHCMPCPNGKFQMTCNQATTCSPCASHCRWFNSDIKENCTATSDLVCECEPGYFLINQGDGNGICKRHKQCPPGQGVSRPGTAIVDVQCEPCVNGSTYSNLSSSTQLCQKCSTCFTTVTSPCTFYKDTNCSSAPATITDGLSQTSTSVIIAVCVLAVAVAVLGGGLLIYILNKRRRRNQEQENETGQLPELPQAALPETYQVAPLGASFAPPSASPVVPLAAIQVAPPAVSQVAPLVAGQVANDFIYRRNEEINGGYMVSLTRDSSDIEMDVEPIDQNDIDLHQNHVLAAAEHNNAGFPDIYFQNTESRDQTQPKERVSAAQQTKRIQQAVQVHSILDTLTENIVNNFPTFFQFLVILSVQHDQEPPNVNAWIEQEYENSSRNIKEAHYKLLYRWKEQHGGIDKKFCQNIKKALKMSGEKVVLAKLEPMFRECFFSS